MSFGIEGTTASGGFLIDSTTSATEYLTVVSTGSTSGTNQTVNHSAGDLVFAKPFDTSSSTANRVVFENISSISSIKFLHRVFYVVLRKAQSTTTSGSNFGIQVKNASNVIIFDSRSATTGMKVLGGKARTSFAATNQPGSSAGTNPTNPVTSVGGVSTIIHSGNPTNVYMACTIGFYSIVGLNSTVIGAFFYDYSNNRILGEGYIHLGALGGSPSPIAPPADTLIGALVT